ncbi:hypothetical protein ACVMIH_007006 [Bradyrhizobium sp. USDA 4503]
MAGSSHKQGADAYDERYERYRRQRHEAVLDAVVVTEPEHMESLRRGLGVRIYLGVSGAVSHLGSGLILSEDSSREEAVE